MAKVAMISRCIAVLCGEGITRNVSGGAHFCPKRRVNLFMLLVSRILRYEFPVFEYQKHLLKYYSHKSGLTISLCRKYDLKSHIA
jgi:hypothetical protein